MSNHTFLHYAFCSQLTGENTQTSLSPRHITIYKMDESSETVPCERWKKKVCASLVGTRTKERIRMNARASTSSIMRCWKIKWSSAMNRGRSYNVYWAQRSTKNRIICSSGSSLISLVIQTLHYSKILHKDTVNCELWANIPGKHPWW